MPAGHRFCLALAALLGIAGGISPAPAQPASGAPGTPSSIGALPAPVPTGATLDNPDPAWREAVLRQLIYSGKIQEALAHLENEKTADVLQSALGALANVRAGEARDFILARCRADDPGTAAEAYRALGPLRLGDTALFVQGFGHAAAAVRRAALQSAPEMPFRAELLDGVLGLLNDPDPAVRQGAIRAGLKIQALQHPDTPVQTVHQTAEKLVEENTARAGDILVALLAQRIQPGEPLARKLATLSPQQLRQLAAIHSAFPDQLDGPCSACWRNPKTAPPPKSRWRSSPKNDATLQVLAAVLAKAGPDTLEKVFSVLDSDLEFAHVAQVSRASGNEESRHDPFAGPGSTTTAVTAGNAEESEISPRHPRVHLLPFPPPAFANVTRFFSVLQGVARDTARPKQLRDEALLAFQQQARGLHMLDTFQSLLGDTSEKIRQRTAGIALDQLNDLRFAEAVLLAAQKHETPYALVAEPQWLAPYLVINDPASSRVLARAARLMLAKPDLSHQLLGLALLTEHGTPANASQLFPFCESSDEQIRRAAGHALSRVSPEVFFLRMELLRQDPSPRVRATLPLAFFKASYRWEHTLDDTRALGHWTRPRPDTRFPDDTAALLTGLASDPDPGIRTNARLALLQHGGTLPDETLLADFPGTAPGAAALPGAIIRQARQAGTDAKPIPAPSSRLAVFIRPNATGQTQAESAVYALRQLQPEILLDLAYRNDDHAVRTLALLLQHFPLPREQESATVLVFSSGAWWAGEQLDIATLLELAEHGRTADNPRLLEQVLQPRGAFMATPPVARKLPKTLLLGAASLSGLLLLGGASALLLRRRARKTA